MMATVLVTGGAGYIGSHTVIELLKAGHRVVIVDNLSNSHIEVIDRISAITGTRCEFMCLDITDRSALLNVFSKYAIDAVMHFAGLKSVSESIEEPLAYYHHNVVGSQSLLSCMLEAGIYKLVFSSSATVYGDCNNIPYKEDLALGKSTSVYGQTKQIIEHMITDVCHANAGFDALSLRYFNPIGAHSSGQLGEWPKNKCHNVMPALCEAALKKRPFAVYGNDFPTQDGTCRRDYIHVMDVAKGHVDALHLLLSKERMQHRQINLGAGTPISVLELVNAFKHYNQAEVTVKYNPARAGDLPEFWADSSKAKEVLGWQANKDLPEMVKDAWRWALNMPDVQ